MSVENIIAFLGSIGKGGAFASASSSTVALPGKRVVMHGRIKYMLDQIANEQEAALSQQFVRELVYTEDMVPKDKFIPLFHHVFQASETIHLFTVPFLRLEDANGTVFSRFQAKKADGVSRKTEDALFLVFESQNSNLAFYGASPQNTDIVMRRWAEFYNMHRFPTYTEILELSVTCRGYFYDRYMTLVEAADTGIQDEYKAELFFDLHSFRVHVQTMAEVFLNCFFTDGYLKQKSKKHVLCIANIINEPWTQTFLRKFKSFQIRSPDASDDLEKEIQRIKRKTEAYEWSSKIDHFNYDLQDEDDQDEEGWGDDAKEQGQGQGQDQKQEDQGEDEKEEEDEWGVYDQDVDDFVDPDEAEIQTSSPGQGETVFPDDDPEDAFGLRELDKQDAAKRQQDALNRLQRLKEKRKDQSILISIQRMLEIIQIEVYLELLQGYHYLFLPEINSSQLLNAETTSSGAAADVNIWKSILSDVVFFDYDPACKIDPLLKKITSGSRMKGISIRFVTSLRYTKTVNTQLQPTKQPQMYLHLSDFIASYQKAKPPLCLFAQVPKHPCVVPGGGFHSLTELMTLDPETNKAVQLKFPGFKPEQLIPSTIAEFQSHETFYNNSDESLVWYLFRKPPLLNSQVSNVKIMSDYSTYSLCGSAQHNLPVCVRDPNFVDSLDKYDINVVQSEFLFMVSLSHRMNRRVIPDTMYCQLTHAYIYNARALYGNIAIKKRGKDESQKSPTLYQNEWNVFYRGGGDSAGTAVVPSKRLSDCGLLSFHPDLKFEEFKNMFQI